MFLIMASGLPRKWRGRQGLRRPHEQDHPHRRGWQGPEQARRVDVQLARVPRPGLSLIKLFFFVDESLMK